MTFVLMMSISKPLTTVIYFHVMEHLAKQIYTNILLFKDCNEIQVSLVRATMAHFQDFGKVCSNDLWLLFQSSCGVHGQRNGVTVINYQF